LRLECRGASAHHSVDHPKEVLFVVVGGGSRGAGWAVTSQRLGVALSLHSLGEKGGIKC